MPTVKKKVRIPSAADVEAAVEMLRTARSYAAGLRDMNDDGDEERERTDDEKQLSIVVDALLTADLLLSDGVDDPDAKFGVEDVRRQAAAFNGGEGS